VGIAPVPAGSAGHKTHEHSLGIGLNNASKNKDAAGKFLVYLLSQGVLEIYAKAGGTPPVSPVLSAMAATRPDFSTVAEYLDKYSYVINDGTAPYAVPVYQILADEFSAVWAGQESIDAALASAALHMTSTINK
jgi:multiple sugar transport system substrate-binding protein